MELAQHYDVTQKVVWGWMRRAKINARVAAKRNQRGESNSSWKGSKACYTAFHARVIAFKGQPQCCEECGTTDPSKSYDWANLTGNYADVNDYKRLCRSCHWKRDGKIRNITQKRERCRN